MAANGSGAAATSYVVDLFFGPLLAAASAICLFSRDLPPRSVSTV